MNHPAFGLIGVFLILLMAWIFSENKKAISIRTVLVCFALQVLIAVLVLYVPFGQNLLTGMSDLVITLLSYADVGINFALFAFVAVALGGFGSIIGCLYAGIIIGLVESLGGLLIDPSFKLLYVFAIYLLVVIFRPQGLFGRY